MFKHIKKFFKGSLHSASFNGDIEAVKRHLDAGEDVNEIDGGRTPLHVANLCGGRKEIVELLIANGANVNKRDVRGSIPLHFSAWQGNKEIAELFIAKGAGVNTKNEDGETPLDWAKESSRDPSGLKSMKKEVADLLRKHGGKKGKELRSR